MNYQDYKDEMAKIDGREVDIEAQNKLMEKHGITVENFNWKGHNNEGNATVYLKDGEPVEISWFIWTITDENLQKNLEEHYGPITIYDGGGGNGHCFAYLKRPEIKEEE